jgi:hypothetical protein
MEWRCCWMEYRIYPINCWVTSSESSLLCSFLNLSPSSYAPLTAAHSPPPPPHFPSPYTRPTPLPPAPAPAMVLSSGYTAYGSYQYPNPPTPQSRHSGKLTRRPESPEPPPRPQDSQSPTPAPNQIPFQPPHPPHPPQAIPTSAVADAYTTRNSHSPAHRAESP